MHMRGKTICEFSEAGCIPTICRDTENTLGVRAGWLRYGTRDPYRHYDLKYTGEYATAQISQPDRGTRYSLLARDIIPGWIRV